MNTRITRGAVFCALVTSLFVSASASAVDLPQIPTLPSVTVLGPNAAKLEASVNPLGLELTGRYDCTTPGLPTVSTSAISIGAGQLNPTVIAGTLLNLVGGKNYDCRLVIDTPAGQVASSSFSLATPAPPLVNPATGAPVTSPAQNKGAARCTITGTPKADRLKGTSKRDVICGLGGNDRIAGRGGSDLIYGGAGKDRVTGGRGKDRLFGNAGKDRLTASDDHRGGDRVDGGAGRDKARLDRGDRVVAVESVVGRGKK